MLPKSLKFTLLCYQSEFLKNKKGINYHNISVFLLCILKFACSMSRFKIRQKYTIHSIEYHQITTYCQCFLCALCKKSMAGRGFITGSHHLWMIPIKEKENKTTILFRRGGDHLPRLCQRKAYGPSVAIEM